MHLSGNKNYDDDYLVCFLKRLGNKLRQDFFRVFSVRLVDVVLLYGSNRKNGKIREKKNMLTCSNRHRYLFISEILSSERCDVTCLALLIIKSLKFSLNGKFSVFDSIEKLFDFEFSYEIHKSIEKNSLHHVMCEVEKFQNFGIFSNENQKNPHKTFIICIFFVSRFLSLNDASEKSV